MKPWVMNVVKRQEPLRQRTPWAQPHPGGNPDGTAAILERKGSLERRKEGDALPVQAAFAARVREDVSVKVLKSTSIDLDSAIILIDTFWLSVGFLSSSKLLSEVETSER
jgi:hypothetical protein